MAGFGRIVLVGATLVAGFGFATVRAQQALDDPKNAPRIFANTCSGCHKSPAGLAKNGGTAGFLRQHYTTGPEMSNAMAAYLASAGNGPAPTAKKNEKQKEPGAATAAKTTPNQKVSATHPLTDGASDPPRVTREKEKQKNAKSRADEKASRVAARPPEPVSPPAPVPTPAPEQTAQPAPEQPAPASSTAALNSAPAPASAPEPSATPPGAVPDLPAPPMPSEPPADLSQPPVFSSAPLP